MRAQDFRRPTCERAPRRQRLREQFTRGVHDALFYRRELLLSEDPIAPDPGDPEQLRPSSPEWWQREEDNR
jgi:hypothetical protein